MTIIKKCLPTLPKIFSPVTQNTYFLFCLIITEIEIIDFAEGRAAEIKALEEVVNIAEGGKNVIQKLPRHMRRRAMSHNIKRLPKNLRAFATFQVSVLEAFHEIMRIYHGPGCVECSNI